MTASKLRSLAAYIDEEAHTPDHILDERLGQLPHELEEPAVYGAKAGCRRLDHIRIEEGAGLDADGLGQPRHQVGRGLEPPALDAAHRLGGDPHGLRDIGLREASLVPKGSNPSPEAERFLRSGHARRVGRSSSRQKDWSRHVMRLDLRGDGRDHGGKADGLTERRRVTCD